MCIIMDKAGRNLVNTNISNTTYNNMQKKHQQAGFETFTSTHLCTQVIFVGYLTLPYDSLTKLQAICEQELVLTVSFSVQHSAWCTVGSQLISAE